MNDKRRWPEVSTEVVARVTEQGALARMSYDAWERYVSALVPGTEMDVAALSSVSGPGILNGYGTADYFYAAPVSTDFDEARWLCRIAEVNWSISCRTQWRLNQPPDEIEVTVSSIGESNEYEGEWRHRPPEEFLDPDDIQRALAEGESAEDYYHECGKPRCIADAMTRALMMMFSPTDEELAAGSPSE